MRGYDPTSTDITVLFWNHLFQKWQGHKTLALQEAETAVKYWLSHSPYTSELYKKFRDCETQPVIRLKNKCSVEHDNFPTIVKHNQLTICLNPITNKVQLKENLDRELTLLYRQVSRKGQVEDKQLMKDLLESCRRGYQNYLLDPQVTQELALPCAKYLFFRKTSSPLPLDRKFRYTTKIAQTLLKRKEGSA